MTENVQKFLELASQEDEDYQKKLNGDDRDGVIALAAEKGITLTYADLEQQENEGEGEVSLDEADAVAGGKRCACVAGGGGEASGPCDLVCACVIVGVGKYEVKCAPEYHYDRCRCIGMGDGFTTNH